MKTLITILLLSPIFCIAQDGKKQQPKPTVRIKLTDNVYATYYKRETGERAFTTSFRTAFK